MHIFDKIALFENNFSFYDLNDFESLKKHLLEIEHLISEKNKPIIEKGTTVRQFFNRIRFYDLFESLTNIFDDDEEIDFDFYKNIFDSIKNAPHIQPYSFIAIKNEFDSYHVFLMDFDKGIHFSTSFCTLNQLSNCIIHPNFFDFYNFDVIAHLFLEICSSFVSEEDGDTLDVLDNVISDIETISFNESCKELNLIPISIKNSPSIKTISLFGEETSDSDTFRNYINECPFLSVKSHIHSILDDYCDFLKINIESAEDLIQNRYFFIKSLVNNRASYVDNNLTINLHSQYGLLSATSSLSKSFCNLIGESVIDYIDIKISRTLLFNSYGKEELVARFLISYLFNEIFKSCLYDSFEEDIYRINSYFKNKRLLKEASDNLDNFSYEDLLELSSYLEVIFDDFKDFFER